MKKVLFITYDFPYPTNSGGKVRAYNLLKFAHFGFDVSLFSFVRNDYKERSQIELKKIGITSIETFKRTPVRTIKNALSIVHPNASIFKSLYFSEAVKKRIIEFIKIEKIDVVHFESLYTAYYICPEIKALGVKQIYGTENIEFKNYEDYIKKIPFIAKPPFTFQLKKIQAEELRFAKEADLTIAVTFDEAEYFRSVGAAKTAVIPNGVNVHEFTFKPSKRPEGRNLLFVGNFSYFPNRDGILFFCREVLPKLSSDVRLRIIGRGSTKLSLSDSRVECIEYVDDIKNAYYGADVLVSPIQIGGGTNFKVIEAMSCGLPVVMHTSRVNSLRLTPDEDVISANSADEFAEKITMLLANDGLQGKLAKNARKLIEEQYSWEVIGKKLSTLWEEI